MTSSAGSAEDMSDLLPPPDAAGAGLLSANSVVRRHGFIGDDAPVTELERPGSASGGGSINPEIPDLTHKQHHRHRHDPEGIFPGGDFTPPGGPQPSAIMESPLTDTPAGISPRECPGRSRAARPVRARATVINSPPWRPRPFNSCNRGRKAAAAPPSTCSVYTLSV